MNSLESPTPPPQRISAITLSLGLIAVIAVGAVLNAAEGVVIPLLIAWLLSYLLAPPMNFMVQRLRFPAPLAVTCIILLLLLASWGVGIVIQQRLLAFANAFPEYQERLSHLLAAYGDQLDIPAFAHIEANWTSQIASLVLQTSRFFFTFISNAILVMIFLVFMLLAKPYANDKVRAALSPGHANTLIEITSTISRQIGAYLGALFVISLVTGLLVWGALAWMGIEFAFTWGLLAFVLNFIPTVGSIIASIPPVLMALVQHAPDFWPAVGVAAAMLGIQMTLGNIIAPKIYGDRLNLSPVVILLFLVFWGWLWGITGALLAVPIAAAIQITLSHIPSLSPLAVLMGSGRRYAKKAHRSPSA